MSDDIRDSIPALTLEWDEGAVAALKRIPFEVRKVAVRNTEAYAMTRGYQVVTPAVMAEAREARQKAQAEAEARGESRMAVPGEASPGHAPGQGGAFPTPSADDKAQARQFVSFYFYRVDPAWRRLPDAERARHRSELSELVRSAPNDGKLILRTYSLVGTRADCDLMFWRISYDLAAIVDFTAQVSRTGLGKYLMPTHSYLAMTKTSQYDDKLNPEHEAQRLKIVPGRAKYLFVYPFVKTRDWYLLRPHARQGIMDEHIIVGSKYSRVKLNTTYSFGLDDQDFVVAFESNYPQDFLDLVQELRETESSRYTVRDTPTFTCVAMDVERALEALG